MHIAARMRLSRRGRVPKPPCRNADVAKRRTDPLHEIANRDRVRDDTGPAALRRHRAALQDVDVPSLISENQRSAEPAERSADHDRPGHAGLPVPAGSGVNIEAAGVAAMASRIAHSGTVCHWCCPNSHLLRGVRRFPRPTTGNRGGSYRASSTLRVRPPYSGRVADCHWAEKPKFSPRGRRRARLCAMCGLLPPDQEQRPRRHQSAALDLILDAEPLLLRPAG